ncbi:MAG: outer membrane beta-barrel protein [Sedimentisphaerales bacterium]|nr:outer membrane beta-barrel protein [Sedimentisphaerales bacterium]
MKNKLMFLCFILLVPTMLFSWSIEPYAGVSNVEIILPVNIESQPGIYFGTDVDIPLFWCFGFRTGLGILQRRTSFGNNEISLWDLDIPLLLKIQLEMGEDNFFYLAAGGYLGIGITGEFGERKLVFDEHIKRFHNGFLGGIGLQIKRIFCAFYYEENWKLCDCAGTNFQEENEEIYFSGSRFTVGYRFLF